VIVLTATQAGATAELVWTSTDPDPAAGYEVRVSVNGLPATVLGTVAGSSRRFVDVSGLWAIGDVLTYTVEDNDTTTAGAYVLTTVDQDAPLTYGTFPVQATTPRYTDLATVKARAGVTHTDADEAIGSAILAAEYAVDAFNNRSFPDTGDNPEWSIVPPAIAEWATDAAIAVWKAGQAPLGVGNSDAWIGALDTQTITEQVLRHHPLAQGFKAGFGVG